MMHSIFQSRQIREKTNGGPVQLESEIQDERDPELRVEVQDKYICTCMYTYV